MTQLIFMIEISEESPSIIREVSLINPLWILPREKREAARLPVVRQSSSTETTQLSLSNESCEELRSGRFDETSVFADARPVS